MWRAFIELTPVWTLQRAFEHDHLPVFDPYGRSVATEGNSLIRYSEQDTWSVFGKALPLSVPGTVLHSKYSWSETYNFFKTARVDRYENFMSEPNYSLVPVI
jgi:hypothetical protein